jgi:hypothetical protein
LDYWIAANRRAIKIGEDLLKERFLLLNFDSLCSNPVKEINSLIDFLGLKVSPENLDSLSKVVQPQASIGRYRSAGISQFSEAQLETVREMGFTVEE